MTGLNLLLKTTLWLTGLLMPRHVRGGKVIVVRIDLIGDFILFLPALAALRQHYRGRWLILVASSSVAPLLRSCPHVDEVIVYDDRRFRRNPLHRMRWLWRIYRVGGSVALYPCFSRTQVGDTIMLWTGAAEKVAWRSAAASGRDRIYTHLVERTFAPDSHETERNAAFAAALGAEPGSTPGRPALWPDPAARIEADRLLAQMGVASRRLVAVLPGASFELKNWGAVNYRDLCLRLCGETDVSLLLCGRSGEAAALVALFPGPDSRIIDLTGMTELPILAELLARCALVVGNDTGTMHIAIATGVPTVCIVGGGHFGRFMPYGGVPHNTFLYHSMPCYHCDWHCRHPEAYCITQVSLESTVAACLRALR